MPKPYITSSRQLKIKSLGFTLIEIMVVVAIIGVMVAYIGISISRNFDRVAAFEAKRFQFIVDEVRDEAILTGEAYLLSVDKSTNSYLFNGVRAGRVVDHDDGLLRSRHVDDGVSIRWQIFDQIDEDEDQDPQVLISSLGEITLFEVSFIGDNSEYIVFINDEGQLERKMEKRRAN